MIWLRIFLAIVITTAVWFAVAVIWFFWARHRLRRMSDEERIEKMERWFGN
jgi:threonine/homoserine/homoserine lactone efflux protein